MIRNPNRDDLSRTAEIHIYGWRYAYKGLISDIELYKKRTVEKTINSHISFMENSLPNFHIYDDGLIKGIILHGDSRDEDTENTYELCAIYIEPAFIGQGIGGKLLEFTENRARELNKKRVVIWALENNKDAIKFYKKHGYAPDDKTKVIEDWGLKEIRFSKDII